MRFRNAFDVPLPPEEAWAVLTDIPRIAPCMPGAALTEQVDDRTYKGNVAVRLGPVALTFAGTAVFEEVNPVAHTARVKAAGTDAKGRGGANSLVSFAVTQSDIGSHVIVETDLSLSGSVAQYGRGAGMIQQVAAQLINQFAGALREQLKAEPQQVRVLTIDPLPASLITAATPEVVLAPNKVPIRQCGAIQCGEIPSVAPPPAKPISGLSVLLKVLWKSVLRIFGQRSDT
jgi:uncharacterized protein